MEFIIDLTPSMFDKSLNILLKLMGHALVTTNSSLMGMTHNVLYIEVFLIN